MGGSAVKGNEQIRNWEYQGSSPYQISTQHLGFSLWGCVLSCYAFSLPLGNRSPFSLGKSLSPHSQMCELNSALGLRA